MKGVIKFLEAAARGDVRTVSALVAAQPELARVAGWLDA